MKKGSRIVDEDFMIEGKELSPKKVRKIASGMDIPSTTLLPEVLVIDETFDERLRTGPQLYKCATEESPSGYFITIPERMVKKVSKSRIKEGIRHELAHYLERSEFGQDTGQEEDPYLESLKEVGADLRSRPRNLPLALARQARGLQRKYGLDTPASFELISRAARNLGVSRKVITKAQKLCFGDTIKGWSE